MQEIYPVKLENISGSSPYAADFGDFYFSRQNGLAEAYYVFLSGNQLPERWKNKHFFTIAETGFGTGLNFLATWKAWREDPCACDILHYVAIEKHPIPAGLLSRLLNQWPELQSYQDELLEDYPPLVAGMHRLTLAGGRIVLTLCLMDIEQALAELIASVDCWYLDGFAPACNPAMWTAEVMQGVARLSHAGTRLATFTAAGVVRRNLQAAGFVVEKRKGFGQKREMLIAALPGHFRPETNIRPWFALPEKPGAYNPAGLTATVIGGGIAGCQLARSLAERGIQVQLLERHPKLAREASGNPAGVLSPKMTAVPGWGEHFYRQAFLAVSRQLKQLERSGQKIEYAACGALQLNHNDREYQRWLALSERGWDANFLQLLDRQEAASVAGVNLPFGGSYFPQGGWINPGSFCRALIRHPQISVYSECNVLGFQYQQGQWHIRGSQHSLPPSDYLLLCNGRDIAQFSYAEHLPCVPVRGQTSRVTASTISQSLNVTLGHEGYLTPAISGQHIFGATFQRHQLGQHCVREDDQSNWQQLYTHLPQLAAGLLNPQSAHAAIRMTTPDRFPYAGALPVTRQYWQDYAALKHGRLQAGYPAAQYYPGLFVLAGLGSRGLTTSYLCAELVSSFLTPEPLALEKSLYYQLHPARFLVKQIKRAN